MPQRLMIWLFGLFSISLVLMTSLSLTIAQDTPVPDVTGLTIPEAVATLNAAGFRLGSQTASPQADSPEQVPGTIISQSVPAETSAEAGTGIDVTVLSNARMTLIYDDNDLTLINQAGSVIDLTGLVFGSADGTRRFVGNEWRSTLDNATCTQIWSISRREPKQVDGCESIFWLTTNNPDNHFWIQANGVTQFTVTQNGQLLATCDTAPPSSQNAPLTCEFFVISNSISADVTDYIYFAYTRDRFTVINTSATAWMPLTETPIYNFNPQITNPGVSLILGDPALFQNPDTVADITRLAPGQCVMLTLTPLTNAEPPQDCWVVAQRDLDSSVAFWLAPFELESPQSLEGRATCPAATENRLTQCIMPR